MAEAKKMSSAARVKACWSISRLICASACSWLRPAARRFSSDCANTPWPCTSSSVRWAWCIAARLSHSVVAIDVPIAPAVIRTKFDRPAAAGMCSGVCPDISRVLSGMKKKAIAAPWIKVGTSTWKKSVWVVNCERIHSTSAKTMKAPLAMRRGSHTPTFLPTNGVRMMANRPTGASAMPADVAV